MKASTLFVLSIALLVGLGAAAGARYVGLFERKAAETTVRGEPIMVLVAARELSEGIAITSADVRIRELRPDEAALYEQNKANVLPPILTAVQMRVPKTSIKADDLLRRTQFEEKMAVPLTRRLDPDMRAVILMIPKESSAGGVLQLGEYVDVMLTCRICEGPNCERPVIKTACIAKECQIIAKRNNLNTLLTSDPDEKPISYQLQVNPYRAALLEYAKYKGQLSLVPVYSEKATPLKIRDTSSPTSSEMMMPRSFNQMSSTEYVNEDERVDKYNKGDLVVGDADMERIFKLSPLIPKSGPPQIRVRNVSGIQPRDVMVFGNADPKAPATSNQPATAPEQPRQQNYQFFYPSQSRAPSFGPPTSSFNSGPLNSSSLASADYCPDCEKNKTGGTTGTAAKQTTPPPMIRPQ